VRSFKNGFAAVKVGYQWGYIDRSGRLAIDARFHAARDFSLDLAPVQVGRLYGYIDRTGRMRIAPQFYSASPFYADGIAFIELPSGGLPGDPGYTFGFPGYVDLQGNLIWTSGPKPLVPGKRRGDVSATPVMK
jgi:hypothetical protein